MQFFVIGDPISHSLSPCMHQAALATLGLNHRYDALRVTSSELSFVFNRLRKREIHGVNVTLPHKIAAMQLCDRITDIAQKTGAVNTIYVGSDEQLIGTNTDVDGLYEDLLAQSIRPQRALVVGSGGAARAAVVALSKWGKHVDIVARRYESARQLEHSVQYGCAQPWSQVFRPDSTLAPYDLWINATSVGLCNDEASYNFSVLLTQSPIHTNTIVYDMVYRTQEGSRTLLMQHAEQLGLVAIDGLGMLIAQGARSLSLFLAMPIEHEVRMAMQNAVLQAVQIKNNSR